MVFPFRTITKSAEETKAVGSQFGAYLLKEKAGDFTPQVICFWGDLGSGKTTFVQGLVETICNTSSSPVSSPTFTLLHTYQGKLPVYHFDLYRLKTASEFFKSGFDEYLESEGICCIEWAEKIQEHLPPNTWHVTLSYSGKLARQVHITQSLP